MFIVHVTVQVKPDKIKEFIEITTENASNSLREPGVVRFDFFQQQDDPTRFVLVEVYRTSDDPAKHKETAHYMKWKDSVVDLMANPRQSLKFHNVFPDDSGWDA